MHEPGRDGLSAVEWARKIGQRMTKVSDAFEALETGQVESALMELHEGQVSKKGSGKDLGGGL